MKIVKDRTEKSDKVSLDIFWFFVQRLSKIPIDCLMKASRS